MKDDENRHQIVRGKKNSRHGGIKLHNAFAVLQVVCVERELENLKLKRQMGQIMKVLVYLVF